MISEPSLEGSSEVFQVYQMQMSNLLTVKACFQRGSWPLYGIEGKYPWKFKLFLKD